MPKIRVLVVERGLVAEGLHRILSDRFTVVGVASCAEETFASCAARAPHVLVADGAVLHPRLRETLGSIRQRWPAIRVVLLADCLSRPDLMWAKRQGVAGAVLKSQEPALLFQAVERVAKGESHFPPEVVAQGSPRAGAELGIAPTTTRSLTSRQVEALRLLAQGNSRKEIAKRMGISTKTVEFHRDSISRILGMRTIAELTRYALKNGIIE